MRNTLKIILFMFFLISCKNQEEEVFTLIDRIIKNPDKLEFYIKDYGFYNENIEKFVLNDKDGNKILKQYLRGFDKAFIVIGLATPPKVLGLRDNELSYLIINIANKKKKRFIQISFTKYGFEEKWKLEYFGEDYSKNHPKTLGPF